ncbi:acyl-CoA synthetase (AMP-forming)/AMP-acid ligase II [Nocardia kruczakiae]|uniref:Acyl-CoA synthetase (AMP-forming)/AMP-acid ligase II n=1 Tax=Nocardia kruczakiae TaxID=261477 RepID=A0ABU1X8D0_9NOCA|nr:class I adenylate-forming enzyme family protein [Nocardia kruczakiae]MDR7166790.1 acyl-CoA synthetase (AMP-forming)/AMP-acid ligase II [Nocardia kruczakiae]
MSEVVMGNRAADSIVPGSFATAPESYADHPIGDIVRIWARHIPQHAAFVTVGGSTSWSEYDRLADTIRDEVRTTPGGPRSRVALLLPDTAAVHAALCGCSRAGRIAAAVGVRSGVREIAHVMRRTGSSTLLTVPEIRGRTWQTLVRELETEGVMPADVLVVDEQSGALAHHTIGVQQTHENPSAAASFTPSQVSVLNSTSGTTGTPKIVAHTERRWTAFAREAMLGARIGPRDVICSVVPAPYGFGLWSAHFLPALLGIPVVVTARFDAEETAMLIERERVTVLCCVSTQFKMLLRSGALERRDMSSLRVLYTGGEPVPYRDARAFEERTGAKVLQFYGSNESGAVSRTTLDDDTDTRLRTCGRTLPTMNVRVLDDAGADVDGAVRRGRPAVRGPLVSAGYWDDPAADAELYTPDGWTLLGDVVEIDETDRVRVVGRTSDFVIRGGKNVSITEIEELVREHESVTDVAVVGVPDDVYGERVCAVVVLADGATLDAAGLSGRLESRGVTKEYTPEYVVVVDRLRLGPGGKTDRGAARDAAMRTLGLR